MDEGKRKQRKQRKSQARDQHVACLIASNREPGRALWAQDAPDKFVESWGILECAGASLQTNETPDYTAGSAIVNPSCKKPWL